MTKVALDEGERSNMFAGATGMSVLGAGEVGKRMLGKFHTPESIQAAEPHKKILSDWLNSKHVRHRYDLKPYEPKTLLQRLFGPTGGGAGMTAERPHWYMSDDYRMRRNTTPRYNLMSMRQSPAVFAHEAGHAANFRSVYKRLASVYGPDKAFKMTNSFYKKMRNPWMLGTTGLAGVMGGAR
jgi:hypothetical protein